MSTMSTYEIQKLYPAEFKLIFRMGMNAQKEQDRKEAMREAARIFAQTSNPDEFDWRP